VNDADDDFAFDAQGNRDAEMRDAIEKIHCAINGIDDPLAVGFLIASDAFFSIERVTGAGIEQDLGDQVLGSFIELELDIVVRGFIDHRELAEFFVQQFSRFESGMSSECEISHGIARRRVANVRGKEQRGKRK
jgi:hypothetical protein